MPLTPMDPLDSMDIHRIHRLHGYPLAHMAGAVNPYAAVHITIASNGFVVATRLRTLGMSWRDVPRKRVRRCKESKPISEIAVLEGTLQEQIHYPYFAFTLPFPPSDMRRF